jgi:hypothetical protein
MRRVLVPLGVVAVALALAFWPDDDGLPEVADDVAQCSENLRALYQGLLEQQARAGAPARDSGVAFLGALIASGVWADTSANRARLTCPGRDAEAVPASVDYRRLEALSGADSAYAGRDVEHHPLAKFPSGGAENEVLAACDNARGLNHGGCMNVLYSDGSVVTISLAQEIAAGRLAPDARTIPVGPSSPLPELRVLVAD